MDIIRVAKKVGNSAGVLLPKKLLGAEVKISVISRPFNIKKEALKALDSFLPEITGVYVLSVKPAEVLAVSSSVKRKLENEKLKVVIIPYPQLKQDLKTNLELQKKLIKSHVIMNKTLLYELLNKKVRTRL